MATVTVQTTVLDVILKPDDVPGAILPNPVIENNSVCALKRWLECRNLKRDGKKAELVAWIRNCVNNGQGDKIFSGVDDGQWHKKKLNEANKKVPSPDADVRLQPKDVPGAVLPYSEIEKNRVVELKRWLECRNLNKNGLKAELIARVQKCINDGKENDIYAGVDKGKWKEMKMEEERQDDNNAGLAHMRPAKKWDTFPSFEIPNTFNKGHMYFYFIESCPAVLPSFHDKKDDSSGCDSDFDVNNNDKRYVPPTEVNTEKPFKRGKQYLDAKYVTKVCDNENNRYYFVKSEVTASMRNLTYDTRLTISKKSGYIMNASCTCKQKTLGRCSHVSALCLFILKHISENGYNPLSGTSKPCTWKDTGSKTKNPDLIDTVYGEKAKIVKRTEFDPRPSSLQVQLSEQDLNDRLLFMIEKSTTETLLWNKMLRYYYEDFIVDDELRGITEIRIRYFIDQLREFIGATNLILIEDTENQSDSSKWHRFRSMIFTASEAKQVLGLTSTEAIKHYLQKKIWGLNLFKNDEMEYGLINESLAFRDYIVDQADKFDDLQVAKTGLWLNKEFCIGCSPDGIITRLNRHTGEYEAGLLEIKCPAVLKNGDPKDFNKLLNKQQLGRFYLKHDEEGNIFLKKNHKYFYQIQVCLGIHQLKFCDLVVWSKHGIIILPVAYDEAFFKDIAQKLYDRYQTILLPEYFLMRTPRDLDPVIFPKGKMTQGQ